MEVATAYTPIVKAKRGDYSGAAIVGTHSAVIGWTVDADARPDDLMGFSVRRTTFDPKTKRKLGEKWLNGQKRFKSMQEADAEVPSDQCPFQRFRWNDYTLKPERSYLYEVFPMRGRPGALRPDDPLQFRVKPSAHVEEGIGVHVNRGVTAAHAYLTRFEGKLPKEAGAEALAWLERGLKGSLLDFVAKAKPGEGLHVAIYEFFDPEIAQALRAAKDRGVELHIVYHAKKDDHATEKNHSVLKKFGLLRVATARSKTGNISHNKFVVHLTKGGKPKRLWTASANFSENAFYFQTNVGLVFDKAELAEAYERYFQILARNLDLSSRRKTLPTTKVEVIALNDSVRTPPPVVKLLCSPVRTQHVVEEVLAMIARSKSALFLSAPFGLDKRIAEAIGNNDDRIIEYGLANTTAKRKIMELRAGNTQFFTPSRLKTFMGRAWDAKAFGAHKIHAKTLIINPWSETPAVLIGSANFSKGSCVNNDENTLLVENDKRFAAVVTTEFLRMFDHYKSRFWINKLQEKNLDSSHFLDDTPAWADIYFRETPRSHKFRDRIVFSGGV